MKIATLLLVTALVTSPAAFAAIYLQEDFSTYTTGNLVGQNGWTQLGSASANPIQISNGAVVMSGNTADNQDAIKSFSSPVTATPGSTFYVGYQFSVTSPGNNNAGFTSSYAFALQDGGNFADIRVGFTNLDDVNFEIAGKVNGQGANPSTSVTNKTLTFGDTPITLVISWTYGSGSDADTMSLWVNPTSLSDPADLTLTNLGTAVTTDFGALILSQFTFSSDVSLGRAIVADTFSEAFDFVAVPEPGAIALLVVGGAFLFWRTRRKLA